MLKCGIVGLPLSGKTTVFNVITKAGAEVKPYASGKTEPNRAVVSVPDARFDDLVKLFEPKKATPATVEFVDLAGLSRNASKGEGLGNAFLSFVGESEALVHVIRCFENPDVPHPEGTVDPYRDWGIVETELILRDMAVIENRLKRLEEKKKRTKDEDLEIKLLEKCMDHLMEEHPLRDLGLDEEQKRRLSSFAFVTLKPELIVLNLDDSQTEDSSIPGYEQMMETSRSSDTPCVKVFGSIEMELAELDPEEQKDFMDDLAVTEPGRGRLIREAYSLLGLISFFTTGKDEVRAWTLKKGSTAVDAAAAIHSDLARGFIRAQIVHYDDFRGCSYSFSSCREAGKLRLEGKDYVVKDGDLIEIRFNI